MLDIKTPSLISRFLIPAMILIAGCSAGSSAVNNSTSSLGVSVSAPVSGSPPVITPSEALVLPGQTVQFAVSGGNVSNQLWTVNGVPLGSSSSGTITTDGLYTAPAAAAPAVLNSGIRVGVVANGTPLLPASVSLFSPGKFTPGTVSPTANPLVAFYSIAAPEGASVQVRFGPTINYGLTTWSQPAPPGQGGAVNVLVAGMHPSSVYHMRAVIQLADGTQLLDADHTFTTGAIPADRLPAITAQQFGAIAPASGVELLSLLPFAGPGNQLTAVATDLSGNVIWYYDLGVGGFAFPIKLLPNGHMLLVASPADEIREIDLAGTVINRVTVDDLNLKLSQIGVSFQAVGGSIQDLAFHHDVLQLPNGHLILLIAIFQTLNNLGLPPGTPVVGDALVDWDPQTRLPVWTWSTFDHLDVNHAPFGYPDWTHSNAVIYSRDDGNLILSMRNQNWVVKINYRDGAGDGGILWRLGPGGDFTLPSGQAPIEWNYGQHYPTLLGPSTAGIYPLMFFNNGNNRLVDQNNTICGSPGAVGCYSSVPILELNEYTKTAQVLSEDKLSAYSICCGNASLLANGHLEFDVADDLHTPGLSYIQEVTQEQSPALVWQMNITGQQLAYRGFRIPSLYPGVQW